MMNRGETYTNRQLLCEVFFSSSQLCYKVFSRPYVISPESGSTRVT